MATPFDNAPLLPPQEEALTAGEIRNAVHAVLLSTATLPMCALRALDSWTDEELLEHWNSLHDAEAIAAVVEETMDGEQATVAAVADMAEDGRLHDTETEQELSGFRQSYLTGHAGD